jgi:hypothetical protein
MGSEAHRTALGVTRIAPASIGPVNNQPLRSSMRVLVLLMMMIYNYWF